MSNEDSRARPPLSIPIKITSFEQLISILTDESERLGAKPDDEDKIVTRLITNSLPDHAEHHFDVWFHVCCELADREARRQGYEGTVDRALKFATQKVEGSVQ